MDFLSLIEPLLLVILVVQLGILTMRVDVVIELLKSKK